MADPLLKCTACCWRSRSLPEAETHAAEPPGVLGPHRVYAPATALTPRRELAEVAEVAENDPWVCARGHHNGARRAECRYCDAANPRTAAPTPDDARGGRA